MASGLARSGQNLRGWWTGRPERLRATCGQLGRDVSHLAEKSLIVGVGQEPAVDQVVQGLRSSTRAPRRALLVDAIDIR